jgi:predicted peptidase
MVTMSPERTPGLVLIVPASDGEPFEALASKLAHMPLWIFHGEVDATTPVEQSRRAAAALAKVGARATYTELQGVGHNAWDQAYDRPDVAEWMFRQRRP